MRKQATEVTPAGKTQGGRRASRRGDPPKADILVVDDVPANLHLLSDMLAERQYKVRSVVNGHMGLMAVRAAAPDLILLDINMPGMTGYEVCEHLKADEQTRDIPIIFISALDDTEDKVKAFTSGGVDYVTKPFKVEEVLARVETHLALRHLRVELERANRELEKRVEERTAQVVDLAVERDRLERELQLAREMQIGFLPHETPQVPGWEFVARWKPAYQVAGDYYDFIPLEAGHLGLVIADVADKGMPAALFMVLTRSTVRASAVGAPTPAEGITRTNRLLCADSSGGMFVTLFYGHLSLESGDCTYVNAGHDPPLLYRRGSAELTELWPTGMALGVSEEASYEQRTVHLEPGDLIVSYTDGLTDAVDASEREFGRDRLKRIILEQCHSPAEEIASALEQALDDFACDPFDDTAMVLVKRL
jgi:sigma-B regulation protein RsbU (phosphoserine phosphatase)